MSYKSNYALIDWSKPLTIERKPQTEPARSDLPCPRIMADIMEPVQSQATGKFYDSKSAIRAEYKRLGMVEIGNDPARLRKPKRKPIDRKAVHETLQKAEARFKRGERVNRHQIAQA
jgi:hypothetical protein